ncbi:MAG: hypothetical protein MPN21_04660 [Thermoanaerobaculia bacterium]|nr:hypothetical protein [Thermoanaerobaculia bacterium]
MGTLGQLMERLADLGDSLTIYSESTPNHGSAAVVALEPEDGSLPNGAENLHYLLEVDLAKEVAEVWSAWRNGQRPTTEELCEAIVFYSRNDAYPPVSNGS